MRWGEIPMTFGRSPDRFHQTNQDRLKRYPFGFTTSSTHDTKRSEDVRMRMCVLSELPDLWARKVKEWSKLNQFPDPNMEYFFYQTLIGAFSSDPHLSDRLVAYMIKAAKEAKVLTNWVNPDPNYENMLRAAVVNALKNREFLDSFLPVWERCQDLGEKNSYAAITLRLGSPGVFDLYQGTEMWDDSLVDPDNRRVVDFGLRFENWDDPKIAFLRNGLSFRKKHRDLFLLGEYAPLTAVGEGVAFARRYEGEEIFVVARRFFSRGEPILISLERSYRLRNIFTNQTFEGTEIKEPLAGIYHVY